nr:hypothetical protein [Nocardia shimofusensis]
MSPRWEQYCSRAAARRAAAQLLHPDRGGDPAEFVAALAAIDRAFPDDSSARQAGETRTVVVVRRAAAGTWRQRVHRFRVRTGRTVRVRRRRYIAL